MANTNEFIRKLLKKGDAGRTTQGAGSKVNIEVVLYDNGKAQLNGHAFDSRYTSATLVLGRQILQMLELFEQEHKRNLKRAA